MRARLRALLDEYRYERREGGRLQSAARVVLLYLDVYLNPRQVCGFCWTHYWTWTPWSAEVCGHPNCEEARAQGRLGEFTLHWGEE